MNEILLQYNYTEKVNRDMWYASGTRKLIRVLFMLCLALFVLYALLLALLFSLDKNIDWPSEILFWVTFGVLLSICFWRVESLPRRIFRKTPLANTTIEWKITESGIEIVTSTYRINFEWRAFIKSKETAAGFLFYIQPSLGYWISKPAFHSDAEMDLFRSWIQKHNIPLTQ